MSKRKKQKPRSCGPHTEPRLLRFYDIGPKDGIYCEIFGLRGPHNDDRLPILGREDARRLVACWNFLREFPIESIEGRQAKYILDVKHLGQLGPALEGLMAVVKEASDG